MSSVNKRVQEELDWVDKHPHLYIDDVHRDDVKHNIAVGYELRELEAQLNKASIEECPPIAVAISNLKATLRYNRKVEYVSIKCPPTPKTDEELRAEERKRILNNIPGMVQCTY